MSHPQTTVSSHAKPLEISAGNMEVNLLAILTDVVDLVDHLGASGKPFRSPVKHGRGLEVPVSIALVISINLDLLFVLGICNLWSTLGQVRKFHSIVREDLCSN